MTRYAIVDTGGSRSFPAPHPFLERASTDGEAVVYLGGGAIGAFRADPAKRALLVELGSGSLGEATGEAAGTEGSNAVGFARFRLGDGDPSDLVELERQPATDPASVSAACASFAAAGRQVAVGWDSSE